MGKNRVSGAFDYDKNVTPTMVPGEVSEEPKKVKIRFRRSKAKKGLEIVNQPVVEVVSPQNDPQNTPARAAAKPRDSSRFEGMFSVLNPGRQLMTMSDIMEGLNKVTCLEEEKGYPTGDNQGSQEERNGESHGPHESTDPTSVRSMQGSVEPSGNGVVDDLQELPSSQGVPGNRPPNKGGENGNVPKEPNGDFTQSGLSTSQEAENDLFWQKRWRRVFLCLGISIPGQNRQPRAEKSS